MVLKSPAGLRLAAAAALLMLVLFPPPAAAGEQYRDAALDVTRNLLAAFPPVEGYVVSLPAGEVYVDVTGKDLMRPGMELLVFREGRDIVHPVTGDVLGAYEEKLGYLALTEVHEKYSAGALVEGAAEVRPGDRVRISASPLRILLLFDGESTMVEEGRLAQVLEEAARESGRFRLSDEPEWLPRLRELDLTIGDLLKDASSLRRFGEQSGADILLLLRSDAPDSNKIVFEARSLWTGRTIMELEQTWGLAAEPGPAPASGLISAPTPDSMPAAGSEYVMKELPTVVLSMVSGDFRGEGGLDILTTDGRRLTLYSWESGGLLWKWDDRGSAGKHVLSLDAGDINGDGRSEVAVTTVRYGTLVSRILTWDRGEWNELHRERGAYLRLIADGLGGTLLVGQNAGMTTVFAGPVRKYAWGDEGAAAREGEEFPAGVGIFGLALADLDRDGTAEVLALDGHGRIRVMNGAGEPLAAARGPFGGYPQRVQPRDLYGARLSNDRITQGFFAENDIDMTTDSTLDGDIRESFSGRLPLFTGWESAPGVVMPANRSGAAGLFPNLAKHRRGTAVLLRWEGGGFGEVLRSREQEGYVADIAFGDTDRDGSDEILMAVNRSVGALMREKGALVIWDPARREPLP